MNNNYRGIYALSEGSPALAVNIYNKTAYNPKVLTDLSEIKKQVVSLDLHKMPVKDAELKTIAQFENLSAVLNPEFHRHYRGHVKGASIAEILKIAICCGHPADPSYI